MIKFKIITQSNTLDDTDSYLFHIINETKDSITRYRLGATPRNINNKDEYFRRFKKNFSNFKLEFIYD